MNKSDPNITLRLLPFFAGVLGSILLLINRFTTLTLTVSQSRSDVVGVILNGVLILVGLIWHQVQPRSPDAVTLVGEQGFEFFPDLPEEIKKELAWASYLVLTNTVTKSLVVYYQGVVVLRRGILGINSQVIPGKILEKVLASKKPVYLVNLPLYPGRVEFDYLPENTQGVICQPLETKGF